MTTRSRPGPRFRPRRRTLSLLLPLLALPACELAGQEAYDPAAYRVAAPAPTGYDREAAAERTLSYLEALIRLDTQNPPGNERLTALWFDSLFSGLPGVETHVVDYDEDRAHFVARLRAPNPSEAPVLVMGHMDVVGASPEAWETPPFEPTVRDGYLYGRGAIDDKGMLAATAVVFLELARAPESLRRDVVFLGTMAEEGGDGGVDWLLEHHADLVADAEFALNEGGRIRVDGASVRTVNIQTTEKVYYNVVGTARGPSGHGSVPLPDNALAALARAAARVHEHVFPVRLNETTRLYFDRLAEIEEDPEARRAMETIGASPEGADGGDAVAEAAAILSRDPLHAAVLRTGASLTLLEGGIRSNVIPGEGSMTFNVRVPPGEDIREVVETMNRVAGEEAVTFRLEGEPRASPPPSPVTTSLFRAMETAALEMAPETVVVPFMSTGATDGAWLRAWGIPTYGILPLPLPMEDELRMHGDNERAPIPALGWATEYLYRVLTAVAR